MADDYEGTYDGDAGVLADDEHQTFDVSPASISFGAEGGTRVLTLKRGEQNSWSVASDTVPSWLEVSPTSGTLPEGAVVTVSVTAEANGSAEGRSASLQFTDGREIVYVSVTQSGEGSFISIDVTEAAVPAEGGSVEIVVSSNRSWSRSVSASWLEVSPSAGASGDVSVTVTAEKNSGTYERTGTVTFIVADDPSVTASLTVMQDVAEESEDPEKPEIIPDWEDPFRAQYAGEFLSRAGTVWRVEILRDTGGVDFDEVGDLTFPSDSPLTIEWGRSDKLDTVQGSSATLKVVSPGDRTYIDLYTIEPGTVRLDVYKDGDIYWSGALDPEFYEEPYEMLQDYEVELTFSDFGILDRLKYTLTGMRTLDSIVMYAVETMRVKVSHVSLSYVATRFPDIPISSTNMTLMPVMGYGVKLQVRSDNFTDEEGEQMTLRETLEGVLQPLGLKMIQRAGVIYVYDLSGIFRTGTHRIVWSGDSQTLGVDKVYNGVIVTFSPYAQSEQLDGEVSYNADYDIAHINITGDAPDDPDYGDYYSFYEDYSTHGYTDIDFTIFLSENGAGLAEIRGNFPTENGGYHGMYFHILPVLGNADECSGAVGAFRTGHHALSPTTSTNYCHFVGYTSINWSNGVTVNDGGVLYRSERVFLPPLSETDADRYKIRVAVEALIDARYNPFSGASDDNDDNNQSALEGASAFVFVPAAITLYDGDGNAVAHYSNREVAEGSNTGLLNKGQWEDGPAARGDCWLEWYDTDDPQNSCGIGGWKSNRHCVGRPDGRNGRATYSPTRSFSQAADGEYVPYPAQGGWLEITLGWGFRGFSWRDSADFSDSDGTAWHNKDVFGGESYNIYTFAHASILRWALFKAPVVELVNNSLVLDSADLEDIETKCWINAAALDDLRIDTVCGTCGKASPAARGALFRTDTGEQIQELYRSGVTASPELLLSGTAFVHHSMRHTTLTGECLTDGGLHVFYDENHGWDVEMADGQRMIMMSEVQDLISDTSEAEFCDIEGNLYIGEKMGNG